MSPLLIPEFRANAAFRCRFRPAGLRLCRWLDAHLDRFEPPPCADFPVFEQVKPLGELLLILFALRQPRHLAARSVFSDWAKQVSAQLWDLVECYAASIPWKTLKTVVAERPDAAIPLIVVPLMETLAGRGSRFHNEVCQTVADAREPTNDLSFLRDFAGTADCTATSCKWLQDEVAILRRTGARTSSALYAITHATFYATRMGHRPLDFLTADRFNLAGQLVSLAQERLAMADYDLGSELLLAARWAYPEEPADISGACETLAEIAEREGSIPPHPRQSRASADVFENRYHPTLTALAVLGEII
jgi:hypothetical protein